MNKTQRENHTNQCRIPNEEFKITITNAEFQMKNAKYNEKCNTY